MSGPVFVIAAAMVCGSIVMIVKTIAVAVTASNHGSSEAAQLREEMLQHMSILEETQNTVALQSTQIAELQDRVDFAERLLTQARERESLGPGEGG